MKNYEIKSYAGESTNYYGMNCVIDEGDNYLTIQRILLHQIQAYYFLHYIYYSNIK